MIQTHYGNLFEYCLSKTNSKVFRPQSSRYSADLRKMSSRHQRSVDYTEIHPPENLLRKRSNSLQSLSSVDHQKSNSKERKINFKPVKIAWASRAASDEKNFKTAFENWKTGDKPVSSDEHVEPCLEYKNKLDETNKKKCIDIFLSRNFIDPTDILPSTKDPRTTLLKNLGTSFTKCEDLEYESTAETYPSLDINFPVIADQDDKKDSDSNSNSDIKAEKKVTFATDMGKMSAETRRMNFRNSYSKHYTTHLSFSSPRLEKQTSTGKYPAPKTEPKNEIKRGNSLTLPESNDESRTTTSPSPTFKPPVQIDKTKQFVIKRKLKSCRSKSFHKSFDNSSTIENVEAFTFRKPIKSTQHADVVTMVSLIVSNEDQDSETSSKTHTRNDKSENTSTKDDKTFNKSEKQPKTSEYTGILKGKWQSENIKRISTQPLQKKRIVNTSIQKSSKSPEKERNVLSTVDNFSTENIVVTSNSEVNNLKEKSDQEDKDSNEEKSFQSAKEQECWSSFRKMTNKGFSVSFDTILRGLLTPTEYRLRKNELIPQES